MKRIFKKATQSRANTKDLSDPQTISEATGNPVSGHGKARRDPVSSSWASWSTETRGSTVADQPLRDFSHSRFSIKYLFNLCLFSSLFSVQLFSGFGIMTSG
jgi:hypothetical protein